MIDELFGDIEYDFQWMGKCVLPIFGKRVAIALSIPCDEASEIEVAQREAFATFQEHKGTLCRLAEEAIFEYYLRILPECRARFGPEFADQWAPEVGTLSDVGRLVTLTEMIIQRSFTDPRERVVGLLFDCSWDVSLGLAVKFINEHLSEVGTQDIVL
ncbi:DUF6985 domain-containing protein [Bradyrhizobium sp. SYSU BS000235]|uniref:DUF6985 domain-containing protein n=1 Tax=Bradyrhizobium sp. SYSU BS000235 TaxID=3411332 RepID=UPI003C786C37